MLATALLLLAVTCTGLAAGLNQDYASRPDGRLRLHVRSAGDSRRLQRPLPGGQVTFVRSLAADAADRAKRQADEEDCVCIEYYLCVNGTIDPSGGFAIDKKLGEDNDCPPTQICCRPPPGFETPKPGTPTYEPQVADSTGCGLQRRDANAVDELYSRIHDVDDREAYYGEFPWMLAVLMGDEFVCGASLIHPQVALTAAHCVKGKEEPLRLTVRAGEWDPLSLDEPEPQRDVPVARTVLHPRFNDHSLYHDVALLQLAEPLAEGRSVGLVCVASSPGEYDPRKCLASGWGTDQQGIKLEPFKTTLRGVGLPIVPHDECQSKLRQTRLSKYFMLHDSFICSGGKAGKDTCKGDGGGPLVCPLKDAAVPRYVQVGVVSWGVDCGEQDVPSVYVDVAKHAAWISAQLRDMGYQMQSFEQ